jgi:hypothetical protein
LVSSFKIRSRLLPVLLVGAAEGVEFFDYFGRDAFGLQVLFENGDVAAELLDAGMLDRGQALANLADIERGLEPVVTGM